MLKIIKSSFFCKYSIFIICLNIFTKCCYSAENYDTSKITVIGLGLIGGSIAYDLKDAKFASTIVGVDANQEHCAMAKKLGFVDQTYSMEDLPAALNNANIVILAVPVNIIIKILPKVLNLVQESTTVIDVGSTKESICNSVLNHAKRKQFVATHPMAGTEYSGPAAALKGLFKNKKTIICDANKSGKLHLNRVKKLYSKLQVNIVYLSAKEHDHNIAYVSHLSHVSSFALANTVLEQNNFPMIINLAGGGFQSTVRLAKSSPDMWLPIFLQNKQQILGAVNSYIDHLIAFRNNLEVENIKEVKKFLTKGNQIKELLKENK